MTTDLSKDVANQLFDAIERGDYEAVENLWADDVLVWHSGDPKDNQRTRALKVIRWFMDITETRSYQILDRQLFDGGFVQQHMLRARRSDAQGERSDGRGRVSIEMRVCIVIKVDNGGLITRIDEYFDPADMAPLLES
jgi:ketosteroid isomerase-like protein